MITLNLLHHVTRLPLQNRAVQLIFTDTAFGWMRLGSTNDEGMTVANTYPGPARIYVDGELMDECWMEGQMVFLLEEGVSDEEEVADNNLIEEARPDAAEPVEAQVYKPLEQQSESASQLKAVLPGQAIPPGFLIA